jgi:hypothetical protein
MYPAPPSRLNFRPVMGLRLSHVRLLPSLAALALCISTPSTLRAETPVSFELDVQPILTARGCNQGACHGKQRGQNGFQLSLLGFDPDFDHAALTMNARGRRVFPAAPDRSLLLLKATARLPHGGGERIPRDSDDYQTLLGWVAQGVPRRVEGEPKLTGVSISESQRLLKPGESFGLAITAHYSDGASRDVTARTAFQSNESAIVAVDDAGRVTAGPLPGEAAIMARYMGHIAVSNVAIPLEGEVDPAVYRSLPRQNFIDELVWKKLETLRITPSAMRGSCVGRISTSSAGCRRSTRSVRSWPTPIPTSGPPSSTGCSRGPNTPTTGPTNGPTCCGRIRTASASKRC